MKKEVGIGLIILGLVMLFKSLRVSNFGFYRFGSVSTAGIIIVLLIISTIFLFVKRSKLSITCVIVSLSLLVISIILGTHIYFSYISLFDLLLMLLPTTIGISLVIKALLENKKTSDERGND